jgi:hypothetical protein
MATLGKRKTESGKPKAMPAEHAKAALRLEGRVSATLVPLSAFRFPLSQTRQYS